MIDQLKAKLQFLLDNPQATKRLAACVQCDQFIKPTGQCQECACIMRVKVLIPSATCPLKKW